MFSCDYCEIFKNSFFSRSLLVAAYESLPFSFVLDFPFSIINFVSFTFTIPFLSVCYIDIISPCSNFKHNEFSWALQTFLVKLNLIDFHFNNFLSPYATRFVKRTMFVNKVNCMVKHNEIPRTCFSYEKPLQCLLISANAYFCTFADENEKNF